MQLILAGAEGHIPCGQTGLCLLSDVWKLRLTFNRDADIDGAGRGAYLDARPSHLLPHG